MTLARCATCYFGDPTDADPETPDRPRFWCRRYPPQAIADQPDHPLFPLMSGNDWCGEWQIQWKPKKAARPPAE